MKRRARGKQEEERRRQEKINVQLQMTKEQVDKFHDIKKRLTVYLKNYTKFEV